MGHRRARRSSCRGSVGHGRDRRDGSGSTEPRAAEARLAEAVGLAASIGLVVVHTAILPLRSRRPADASGRRSGRRPGKVARAEPRRGRDHGRRSLSPVQQRNLERAWNCKVIDRPA